MDRPKPMATVLSFTTPRGNIIGQALHRDGPAGFSQRDNWPRRKDAGPRSGPVTWALQLGPELRRTDSHLLLPDALRRDLLPLEAETEAEALEALDRAALALEDFLEDFASLQSTLAKRVAGAQAHGRTPGLPLGEPQRCGEPYPNAPSESMRCVREPGHDGQHGYAGMRWDA